MPPLHPTTPTLSDLPHASFPHPLTPGAIDDDAESAGAPGASAAEEPGKELGDAGMVLRDPSTFHLILHHVGAALLAVMVFFEVAFF